MVAPIGLGYCKIGLKGLGPKRISNVSELCCGNRIGLQPSGSFHSISVNQWAKVNAELKVSWNMGSAFHKAAS